MSLQLLHPLEPQRLDDSNLSELVCGTSDVKFIIKSYPIPDKPKSYNHLLIFEKLLKNGFIKLVSCQLEKDNKTINVRYCGIKINDNFKEILTIEITNALDHQTDFKYDLGTGNLLWNKENGIYTFFYYDTFGRLTKEVQPFDSFDLPTKSYNYSFDGTAPESIKISQRTTANKTFDTYFYYDGIGNFIQFKKPSDGGQQIVKNLVYDGMGRVSAESNPYFASFSTGLTTQNSDFMNYTYDALSRVISVRNPDGNISSVRFDHWNITAYDENNHRKMYSTDAYGRIVNVLGGFYDN